MRDFKEAGTLKTPSFPVLPIGENLVLSCLVTGVHDVNRNTTLTNEDDSLFREWADSISRLGLQGILFHNNLTDEVRANYQNGHIQFIRIDHRTAFNPNVYRYFVYQQFLQRYAAEIKNLFITDMSDVVVVQNPFIQPLFLDNPDSLFTGDEPKQLDNEWMRDHSEHLRATISDYASYEETFKEATLLNCGIVGGSRKVMVNFIDRLVTIHDRCNRNNTTAYTGDMGAFNYLVRTQYNNRVLHGPPINTVFKEYQSDRTDCWLRHK